MFDIFNKKKIKFLEGVIAKQRLMIVDLDQQLQAKYRKLPVDHGEITMGKIMSKPSKLPRKGNRENHGKIYGAGKGVTVKQAHDAALKGNKNKK